MGPPCTTRHNETFYMDVVFTHSGLEEHQLVQTAGANALKGEKNIWAIPFIKAWNLFKVPCRTFLLKCPGRLSLVGLVNIWPAQVSVWNVLETPPPCHKIQIGNKNKTKTFSPLKQIQIWYWDKYTITIADKYVGCNGEAGTSLLHLPILVEPLSPANTWVNSKI